MDLPSRHLFWPEQIQFLDQTHSCTTAPVEGIGCNRPYDQVLAPPPQCTNRHTRTQVSLKQTRARLPSRCNHDRYMLRVQTVSAQRYVSLPQRLTPGRSLESLWR